MDYVRAFIVGGLICVIGQILIDKTKLMSGRILVIFVIAGCILGGLGIYEALADFGGAGATVPLTGFGYNLAKGVMKEVDNNGLIGVLTGGLKASAGGISAAILFAFLASLVFEPKEK
ncbi:MAG: stage V sporulation protein AE [Tyzzerella sp.]|uniref:Stage V sporulation protein AE n=1 Tax=Candidatus Fimicola merdigallinarum TaxID=2840819 RepID=A0A9D9H4H5_9FIRM|nr:stage V sporulation protein AE [Candidatus Fimicola merdigallinarum]